MSVSRLARLTTLMAVVLLLILMVGGSAAGASAQSGEPQASRADLRAAERSWRRYVDCEISRRFRPCYSLLSQHVLDLWKKQGRSTIEEYVDTKGSEEIRFINFRITASRGTRSKVTIYSRAKGDGEGGPFEEDRAYTLVREGATWKIHAISEGINEYLP